MPLRNGPHGYGLVTKTLHWLTLAVLVAQFVVGYSLGSVQAREVAEPDCDPPGERIGGGDTDRAEEDRLDALEDACEARAERRQEDLEQAAEEPVATAYDDLLAGDLLDGGVGLGEWHVLLGLGIALLAVTRLLWRRTTPLPPWSDALGPGERRLEARLEKVLLAGLLLIPGTGVVLVVAGEGDDLLWLHVAAHLGFFTALALHVGLVLRHTVVRRERHLMRML